MPWTSNKTSICSSSGRLQDVSWRRLQNIFSVTYFYLPKCLQDVLKASCKYVLKTSLRHFPRRLEEVNIKIWPRVNITNLLISYTKYLSSKTYLRKKDKTNCNSQTQQPSWHRFHFMHHKNCNHIPTQTLELIDNQNG